MFKFALRRMLSTIPVLFIAVTFCFFVLRLAPGGPFDGERPLPPQIKANLEAHYHMDKPLLVQYGLYLKGLAKGDLGPSFTDYTYSVNEKLKQGLPYTLKLGGLALILAVVLGVVSGVFSALFQNRWPDYILAFPVLLGLVVPNFVLAPLMQEYLGKDLDQFLSSLFGYPVDLIKIGGWGDGSFKYLFLPVFVLSLPYVARISRLTRGSMIETLNANFVRTAKAKGIGARLVLFRHALRPALIPVLSFLGPAAGYLLTGSIIIEGIFGLPGVGKFFIDAALNRDYGMVLGTVVFYMFLIIVLNLVVDLLYALLDPKVRYS